MPQKILILYQFESHYNLLSGLMERLKRNQIYADSFNVMSWELHSLTNGKHYDLNPFIRIALSLPKLRGVILRLFGNRKMLQVAEKYNKIDIHFFSPLYFKILPQMKLMGKTIKVTLWGSDFYNCDSITSFKQASLFRYIDIIQVSTEKIRDDFLIRHPECKSKMRVGHFGIENFDRIEKVKSSNSLVDLKKQLKMPENRFIITCGYNGSNRQQHKKIIDSISSLSVAIKERAFFLFLMTYGSGKAYIQEINRYLQNNGLYYRVLNSRLVEEEIAAVRVVTDIFINIQVSDSFSASMQEHIYAGNVVVTGDWLPYDIFVNHGIYLRQTKLVNLAGVIEDTIINYDYYKAKTLNNKQLLKSLSSWDNSISDWVNIYQELESHSIQNMNSY